MKVMFSVVLAVKSTVGIQDIHFSLGKKQNFTDEGDFHLMIGCPLNSLY